MKIHDDNCTLSCHVKFTFYEQKRNKPFGQQLWTIADIRSSSVRLAHPIPESKMVGGIRKPRSFHLSCPYTSLPVCHCRLYVPAPASYTRNPVKNPRPRHENPLRRALLLEILYATSALPSAPQCPSPTLTYALHTRAAHGTPPIPSTTTAISAFARARDIADEETLMKHKARELEARQQAVAARNQLEGLETREKDSEAARRVRQDRLAETSDDASEPDPGHVRRRGRPRKTR